MYLRNKMMIGIMCLCTTAALLSGCGSSGESKSKDIVKTEETAGSSVSASEENTDSADESNAEESAPATESDSNKEITIEEQVLVEQDGIKITALEYVRDNIWGDGIKVLIENESEKDVTVGCDALIVNDYMIYDLFVSEIAAGKKSNATIYLSSSELKAAGIDTVGRIEIYFHAYDADSFEGIFTTDCIEIETSAIDSMDTTLNDEGTELYNEGGVRIVGKTVDENSFWGTAILLYIENESGRNVGISVDDMSINGFMLTPYFSTTVYDGKKAVDDITIMSSELEENGITSIEEVELKFHIYDNSSYETIADSEPITFSAQ